MEEDILKRYVCLSPFLYLEAHKNSVHSCCPSWLPNNIGVLDNIEKIWNGEELKKIQESILDGSYKFCSRTLCPYLSQLLTHNTVPSGFKKKEDFKLERYQKGPSHVNFAFDRSCNLSCPSCRNDMIIANQKEIKEIDSKINRISENFGDTITLLYLSGSADPLASKSIRNFLINFNVEKFPKIKSIHLHTNALLFNEKLWNQFKNVHKLINSIEISIDASTEKTYNMVRRGGNWNTLINNLHFISKNVSLNKIRTSFVVQDTNYKEMNDFHNLMSNIFKNKTEVYFCKITNWGTYSDEEFLQKQIWSELHPEFKFFTKELEKVHNKFKCIHNMHDIIQKHITKSTNKLI